MQTAAAAHSNDPLTTELAERLRRTAFLLNSARLVIADELASATAAQAVEEALATLDKVTASSAPARWCVNCQHHDHQADRPFVKGLSDHRCTHPRAGDPVTGAWGCCFAARSRGPCGPAGELFVEHVGDQASALGKAGA